MCPASGGTCSARLAPGGLFVDGTCDEIGRRAAWVALDAERPLSLSVSMRFGSFALPSDVAERLPKALIHRNVPGEKVHAYLQAMDRAWLDAAPLASFGNRQRWIAMCRALHDAGWPVQDGPSRWRLGEVTVAGKPSRPDHCTDHARMPWRSGAPIGTSMGRAGTHQG